MIDLRIPNISRVSRRKAYTLVFDDLQSNGCGVMKGYFTKNEIGNGTRSDRMSVKVCWYYRTSL